MKTNSILITFIFFTSFILLTSDVDPDGSLDYEGTMNIGVGARTIALGGAYTSLSDDIYSIYYNPAGIARCGNMSFSFTHNSWLSDIDVQFIGGQYDFGKFGHLGSAISILKISDIEGYDIFGEPTEKFSASSYIIYLTYAREIIKDLYLGGNLKYISDKIETSDAKTLTGDVGFLATNIPIEYLNFGFSMSNTFGSLSFDEMEETLPLIMRFGISYSPLRFKNLITTTSFDIEKTPDMNPIYHFGVENTLYDAIKFRTGYKLTKTDIVDKFSLGMGYIHRFNSFSLSLDLAYTFISEDILGDTTQLSLDVNF